MNIIFKIIGLIILLLSVYFIETLLLLAIFGEGSQASNILNNPLIKIVIYVLPIIIIGWIAFKKI
jgi:hypothetical protein